ncbi:glycosyltransferase family 4 protein [Actinoplanes sp. NEAU-A11]|uniref:Glycosyltransferase family 4 protein n=1 Tax=Actinoplanes aureus TaxID=2792083 RepID=A0A931FXU4_9ACTN|nr:glycosyltransferase family 4 protein [Actinoplanes aureus]
MNILVYPHDMAMGGSQLNAIELAAAVRDLGHTVTIVGDDGELVRMVRDLGLRHVPVPARRRRPSPAVARMLRRMIRDESVDIVHGYEWPPGLEAAAATFPRGRSAAVCTVMSMAVAPFLPRGLPLIVGTRALQEQAAADRNGPVHLIEPPVDVETNSPGHPVAEFRAQFDLRDDHPAGPVVDIVVICRLVPELKLEGVLTAIDVVGELARDLPVRLVVVGDGTARDTVEERAAKANARAGRRAIVLTGQLYDPRAAYAAADIMLGMGGSALRSLAFARPLVVQGEQGFWKLLTPESCDLFLRQGWYGVADDPAAGHERLIAILRELVADPGQRAALGDYGRKLAVERFSLQRAALVQERIYREALAADRHSLPAQAGDGLRSAAGVAAHKVRQRYRSVRGTRKADDFNAVTLARTVLEKPGN